MFNICSKDETNGKSCDTQSGKKMWMLNRRIERKIANKNEQTNERTNEGSPYSCTYQWDQTNLLYWCDTHSHYKYFTVRLQLSFFPFQFYQSRLFFLSLLTFSHFSCSGAVNIHATNKLKIGKSTNCYVFHMVF